jgi:plasmid stabilization system protein ParE
MKPSYVLAPEAAHDLVEIWNYLSRHISLETAKHVESAIREKWHSWQKTPALAIGVAI